MRILIRMALKLEPHCLRESVKERAWLARNVVI